MPHGGARKVGAASVQTDISEHFGAQGSSRNLVFDFPNVLEGLGLSSVDSRQLPPDCHWRRNSGEVSTACT